MNKKDIVQINQSDNISSWMWGLQGKITKKFKKPVYKRIKGDPKKVGEVDMVNITLQGEKWDEIKHPAWSKRYEFEEKYLTKV